VSSVTPGRCENSWSTCSIFTHVDPASRSPSTRKRIERDRDQTRHRSVELTLDYSPGRDGQPGRALHCKAPGHRENLTAMLALASTFTDPAATRAPGAFVANTIVRPEGGRRGVARARQDGTLTLRSKKHTGQPLGVCSCLW